MMLRQWERTSEPKVQSKKSQSQTSGIGNYEVTVVDSSSGIGNDEVTVADSSSGIGNDEVTVADFCRLGLRTVVASCRGLGLGFGNDAQVVETGKNYGGKREYTAEEKVAEAEAIGYKVVGPLDKKDRVFKPYEPVFAVVQIGSQQFKVSNGDCIFTERLKFCEGNDKLVLNKVLLLGSSSQTIIGRPMVPDAAVHAVVEEHALDAKVIIFKKKTKEELLKNQRASSGIEKPENTVAGTSSIADKKKPEKVAVAT
ncbi:50S ribosomal protein L21, mitochondrial-like [Quillaja saponaria]|uniref:Large ribosomal subunit protein bL21m n=1 Tax=Quillaja saponaria TaxID=32244 RepID=A0AAD7PHW7_QUISA|nr:50S ribosomal protein L21, mitochondrial-like [Quillaja saponaria]